MNATKANVALVLSSKKRRNCQDGGIVKEIQKALGLYVHSAAVLE